MSSHEAHGENHKASSEPNRDQKSAKDQEIASRRTLIKAAWIAPVVFSVSASQAFAASNGGRR